MPLPSPTHTSPLVRGVNIGGWLVLERYITPTNFALTKCHLEGDFCWYPSTITNPKNKPEQQNHQTSWWSKFFVGHHEMTTDPKDRQEQYEWASTHPEFTICSQECTDYPVLVDNIFNATDYALDEWNLGLIFKNYSTTELGEQWLNVHFDRFVSYDDLKTVKEAGMTHIRVPLPHWILKNHDSAPQDLYTMEEEEPYLVGDRWKYFVRLCGWARDLDLKVWANVHTAPGSQNAFDNSGHQGPTKTCEGWMPYNYTGVNSTTIVYPPNVQKSLDIVDHITQQMVSGNIHDVITGFGLLNEPYINCNLTIYEQFLEDGLDIVRRNFQNNETKVFVSDMFWAPQFNDGEWWLDPDKYHDTYLDSHYYNVFTNAERQFAPEHHIEHVCDAPQGKGLAIKDCCWREPNISNSTNHSNGVGRIVTEFSVAYDSMPGELLKIVLQGFRENGHAPPNGNRTLSDDRKEFMKLYAQAQMMSFEHAGGHGWFFWSLKMENDVFMEWDFLRGLEEGWFPNLADANTHSVDLYGSCDSVVKTASTLNASEVVHVYPWGDQASYQYWDPIGLGWKFDHDQQTEKKETEGNATAQGDGQNNKKHILQNISDMMASEEYNTSLITPSSNGSSGEDDDSMLYSRVTHTNVSVGVQILFVIILFAFAVCKLRSNSSRISRHDYDPIKEIDTDSSTMESDISLNGGPTTSTTNYSPTTPNV